MEMLLVNLAVGLFLLLFSAMAIAPFLIEGKPARQAPLEDDIVISVQPVASSPATAQPLPTISVLAPSSQPARREAA